MAYFSLKAEFFVTRDGIAIPKAPPLKFKERAAIYGRDAGTCQQCGVRTRLGGNSVSPWDERPRAGAIDHIFPRSRGGSNDQANLQLLCITCNAQKGAK